MKRKSLGIFLLAASALMPLSGCGGNNNNEEGTQQNTEDVNKEPIATEVYPEFRADVKEIYDSFESEEDFDKEVYPKLETFYLDLKLPTSVGKEIISVVKDFLKEKSKENPLDGDVLLNINNKKAKDLIIRVAEVLKKTPDGTFKNFIDAYNKLVSSVKTSQKTIYEFRGYMGNSFASSFSFYNDLKDKIKGEKYDKFINDITSFNKNINYTDEQKADYQDYIDAKKNHLPIDEKIVEFIDKHEKDIKKLTAEEMEAFADVLDLTKIKESVEKLNKSSFIEITKDGFGSKWDYSGYSTTDMIIDFFEDGFKLIKKLISLDTCNLVLSAVNELGDYLVEEMFGGKSNTNITSLLNKFKKVSGEQLYSFLNLLIKIVEVVDVKSELPTLISSNFLPEKNIGLFEKYYGKLQTIFGNISADEKENINKITRIFGIDLFDIYEDIKEAFETYDAKKEDEVKALSKELTSIIQSALGAVMGKLAPSSESEEEDRYNFDFYGFDKVIKVGGELDLTNAVLNVYDRKAKEYVFTGKILEKAEELESKNITYTVSKIDSSKVGYQDAKFTFTLDDEVYELDFTLTVAKDYGYTNKASSVLFDKTNEEDIFSNAECLYIRKGIDTTNSNNYVIDSSVAGWHTYFGEEKDGNVDMVIYYVFEDAELKITREQRDYPVLIKGVGFTDSFMIQNYYSINDDSIVFNTKFIDPSTLEDIDKENRGKHTYTLKLDENNEFVATYYLLEKGTSDFKVSRIKIEESELSKVEKFEEKLEITANVSYIGSVIDGVDFKKISFVENGVKINITNVEVTEDKISFTYDGFRYSFVK